MERRRFLLAMLTLAIGLPGCEVATAIGNLPPMKTMTKSELEAHLVDKYDFHDVTLKDEGGGLYVGKATNGEGKVYDLELKEEDRRRSWKMIQKDAGGGDQKNIDMSW